MVKKDFTLKALAYNSLGCFEKILLGFSRCLKFKIGIRITFELRN